MGSALAQRTPEEAARPSPLNDVLSDLARH
jgi:hypothetical protein